MIRDLLIAALLSIAAVPAVAASPNTLGYQGRLANSSGLPITANLNISFRIYDVASGGVALWSETQNAVPVDGGNLAVELGLVTPLPTQIWGRQLYLGMQIAGDSEMLPRPALTAAPFALRAGGTMRNTVVVSAQGTAADNGIALLAAMPQLAGASASNPIALELDAGTCDIGNQRLNLPSYVTIAGAGQEATLITSAFANGTLLLASNAHARRLTARNTGIPPTDADSTYGIGAADAATLGLVQGISLEDVAGESIAPSGSAGSRQGILLCTSGARVTHVTGRGEGGKFSYGMRSDCGIAANSAGLLINGLTLFSSGGTLGVRGAYLAGGGFWSDILVIVDANASADTVYGVRVLANTIGAGALLNNLSVSINGAGSVSTTPNSTVEAVRADSADIDFKGLRIAVNDVAATQVSGLRVNAIPPGATPVHRVAIQDARIAVSGIQQANLGAGGIYGVRLVNSALQLTDASIKVDCLAGGFNLCEGVRRQSQAPGLQAGGVVLDRVSIEVGHADPADASAQSRGYDGEGAARIVNSSIRVLRSGDGEFHSGIATLSADADIRVANTSIEIISTTTPTADCVLSGTAGSIELYASHVQGSQCAAGASLSCAGNTKRGSGFLASTCP